MTKFKKDKKYPKPGHKQKDNHGEKNSSPDYLLPKKTRLLLSSDQKDLYDHDNFGLMVSKFLPIKSDRNGVYEFKYDNIAKALDRQQTKASGTYKEILDKIKARYESITRAYESRGYVVKTFEKKTISSLAVGLGYESVYDTSLTLHPIYGIPYIPASALKGVVRNWTINSLFHGLEVDEGKGALADENFCKLFGRPKKIKLKGVRGKVMFLDAFPSDSIKVKLDIIAAHYHKYYTSDNKKIISPADYLQPNITKFLTVEKGAAFSFTLMVKESDNGEITLGQSENFQGTIIEVAEKLLVKALTEEGIGAKTSVGYGLFG